MRKTIATIVLLAVMAGAAVAADSVIPNRMAKAKVGEWVLLLDTGGPTAGEKEKFTVTEIKGSGADRAVVIKRERMAEDTVYDTKEMEINLAKYAERLSELEAKAKQVGRETVVFDDRELTLWSITWDRESEEGSHEYRIWVSDQIPVGGFFKSWSSDPLFPAAELVDAGS